MNRIERYYALYEKMQSFGYPKTEIARYFKCSRNTLQKIIDKERVDEIRRMEELDQIREQLSREFFDQIDQFESLMQQFLQYAFQNPTMRFDRYTDAFGYILRYLEKSRAEGKNENVADVLAYANMHAYNFHMRYNPYYYIMRGYFNKEVRPIIDFNIDYENYLVRDFQIKTLRTAHENPKVTEQHYDVDYAQAVQNILHRKWTPRQQAEAEKYVMHPEKIDVSCMTFHELVQVMYLLCIGYSKRGEIRFMAYDEKGEEKFAFIREQLKGKHDKELFDKVKYYNLARLFQIQHHDFLPLEQVLVYYRMDKIAGMEQQEYCVKIRKDVAFRVAQLEELIIMVSGLELKRSSQYPVFPTGDDEDDMADYHERRRQEIQRIQMQKDELWEGNNEDFGVGKYQ